MKHFRKIIAMVLCILMIINILPTCVYAEETQSEEEMIDAGMNSAIAPEWSENGEISDTSSLMSTFSLNNFETKQDVLLIKNKNPWNSSANENVLNALGIGYTTVTVENSVELDFSDYKLIIIVNDQVDSFYRTLSTIRTKLELYVMNGGTLLYGICDAGWGSGYSDLLIPGDIELGPVSYQTNNYIVDKTHPIVTGILTNNESLTNDNLYNTYASHRYFQLDSLPSDTNIIVNAGNDKPTLIEYPIGNGIVIASAMTWEHSYDQLNSGYFGQKAFDDLLLYAYTVANVVTEINKNPGLGFDEYVKGLTCTAGDPVNVANGNFITSSNDLTYEGFVSINFSRYYNSLDSYQGQLGKNWRSNYNIYLEKLSERRLRLWHADGHSEEFIYGDDKIWHATPGTNSNIELVDSLIYITLEDKTVYIFDEELKIVSLKAPYDNEICFEYDDYGNLILAKQGEFYLNYIYENDLLCEVSDKSGRTIKFQYDNGNLVQVENYDDKITKYEYDDAGRMTKMHINNEYTVINNYDEYGRVISQEMSEEGSCQFIYNDENYTTTYIDKNGATTIYYKDEYGRIYKKEYADGTEVLEFDSNNKLIKEIDKLGNSTTYEYDEYGNCISQIDALGNVVTYEYDEFNNKTAIIDAEGNRYEYLYDKDNYIVAQSDAYGNFTFYTYDDKKQLIKVILPNNKELSFEYDEYGNVINAVDSDGNKTCYSYNDMNQIIEETDANGNIVKYEYSDYGRTKKKIYEDGTYNISVYDDSDNLIEYTDELGNTQSYIYNTIGLLIAVKDDIGNATTYEYDCMNNVNKIINPDGSHREYVYDLNNNLIQIIDEEGYKTNYKYDSNGNILEEIDANGNITSYSYDKLNRLVETTDARGNVTTSIYSPNGNLLSVIDADGNSQLYEYNKNNQVITFTNEANEVEKYEYDVMGQVIEVTDANGNTVNYEYNGNGDITKIINPDQSFISITYDGIGNKTSYIEPNGTKTVYEYDVKGRLISENFANNTCKKYSYDAVGNQISLIDENGNETKYEYDYLNRLTKVIDAMDNQTVYSYDVRNNLLATIQYKQVQNSVIESMKRNRGVSYDNTVQEVVTSYEYDKKNQLVKEISPTGQIISYQYDANGNMICKTDVVP
ncbi:MAG: RHS repeat protein [Lachnospiraceae bacterium]|nr:RHS repeat protein [Lachnospiraceae bacterium]